MHVPPRIYRRVPFRTAVRLQFDRFRGFIEEYSANLSLGGMFIRTDSALPLGTVLPIEFRLGEDFELIKGTGRVVWVRDEGIDDDDPAGMGIRFLELTPGSRELIFRMVERRVREGGVPFDVEQPSDLLPGRPPEPGPAPEGEIASKQARPVADDEMPLPAPLLAGPPADRADVPAAGPVADETAEEAGEMAVEPPATRPPAAVPPPALRVPEDAARPPRAAVPRNLSPFSVESGGDEPEPSPPKPSFFSLPGEEPRSDGEPPSLYRRPSPDATSEPFDEPAADGGGDGEAAAGLGSPAAAGGGYPDGPADPAASFADLGFDEAARDDPPAADEFAAAGFAAAELTAAEPDAEGPFAAEPDADQPDAEGPTAEPPVSTYAPRPYRSPVDAGAGVAAEAVAKPAWRRWLVLGLLLAAVAAGAWMVQDRWLGGGEPTAEPGVGVPAAATPAASGGVAGEGEPSPPQGLPAESNGGTELGAEAARAADGGARDGGVAGLGLGDVVGDDGRARSGADEAPVDGGDDPFGPVAMPDGSGEPGGAVGTIQEITWSAEGRRTVLLVWTGGAVVRGDVLDFRIDGDNPRHVVRILGIDQPYDRGEMRIGTRQVRRLRTGLHSDRRPPEIHLVFDLTGPGVEVTGIEANGNRLRIFVEGEPR